MRTDYEAKLTPLLGEGKIKAKKVRCSCLAGIGLATHGFHDRSTVTEAGIICQAYVLAHINRYPAMSG